MNKARLWVQHIIKLFCLTFQQREKASILWVVVKNMLCIINDGCNRNVSE